jgi:predicted transposase YdaD
MAGPSLPIYDRIYVLTIAAPMVKKADIGSKRLISLSPAAWAKWVTGQTGIIAQEIINSEFQWISRDSDVLIKAQHPQHGPFLILNELQLNYTSAMPRRVRAYTALAEEKYNLPVYPVLINFLPPAKTVTIAPNYSSNFLGIHAHQDYRIINLWEIDANLAFQADLLSLLPFVPIMQNGGTPEMLEQAAYQLRQNQTLDEFSPLLGFFANFVLDSALVQQILRWDMVVLEESPWYNEIIRRGEARGRQEEACDMVLRQLVRRVGSIAPQIEVQVRSLQREQLENLGDALLDFTSPTDLVTWMNRNG